jgi:hypothetical protein
MAFFRPVHLGNPPGYRADNVLTQHADVAVNVPIGGVTFLEYLLIIHLRKKISRPGENMTDFFWG